MLRRDTTSRVVGCLLGAMVVTSTLASSAEAAPPCPPQRDGIWSGDFFEVSGRFGTWDVDFTFTESTISATTTITSINGFPVVGPSTELVGAVGCSSVDFHSVDNLGLFSGALSADGMSASGPALFPGGQALWNLSFTTPAPPAVSVGGATVQEGNSGKRSVEIPVTLSRPATSTVKVDYATSGLTALPDDYVPKSGSVSFTPGANGFTPTTKWIKVTISGDVVAEPDEAFGVTLTNPIGATINNAGAAVYIEDDDGSAGPVVSIAGSSVYEGDEGKRDLRLTIWLSQPAAVPVTVEYSTGDGTAIAPGDYRPKSDEFTFKPGQVRKAITIKVVPDDLAEGGFEEFSGYVLGAIGAPIDRDTATFTIHDE